MTTTTTDNGALRSADNWATLVATITGGPMPESKPETAWCADCRRQEEVMDTYPTDDGLETAGQSPTYLARPLACGHSAQERPSARRQGYRETPATRQAVDALAALQDRLRGQA